MTIKQRKCVHLDKHGFGNMHELFNPHIHTDKKEKQIQTKKENLRIGLKLKAIKISTCT